MQRLKAVPGCLLLVMFGGACEGNLPTLLDAPAVVPQNPAAATEPAQPAPFGQQATQEDPAAKYAWVSITWPSADKANAVNLDLHVLDSSGTHIYYLNTGSRDVTGRFAPHDECRSFDCDGDETHPAESIYWERASMEPGTYEAWVHAAEPTDCLGRLERLGVDFERITISEGSCVVEEAVMLNSPVNGITYRLDWARGTTRLRTACETALAIYESTALLRQHDITTVYHKGSYECRNVRNGSSISQHGLARAVDYSGFETSTGTEYSVVRDWEHDTSDPQTDAARVLRQLASGLETYYDRVLDADHDRLHDDHFHAELTGR